MTLANGLNIDIQNTTNRGIGVACDSNHPDGLDNGSVLNINGPYSISVKGRSVIGAVAGSMFKNMSGLGGKLVFGSNNGEGDHVINVVSDWSDQSNTNCETDWAVGLLSFGKGRVEIDGDMDINLHVKNMRRTTHQPYHSKLDRYQDPAAGIYVDSGSWLKTAEGTNLNVSVSGDGSGISGSSDKLPNIYGMYVGSGLFETDFDKSDSFAILNGNTNIFMNVGGHSKDSDYIGISASAYSNVYANGKVYIGATIDQSVDFSESQYFKVYGVSAGTLFPDMTVNAGSRQSGYARFDNGLIVDIANGRNPALNYFVAVHSNRYRPTENNGGVVVDNTSSNALVKIEGQVKTENNGYIWLNLSGQDSFISGSMESFRGDIPRPDSRQDGYIFLKLYNGATWNVLECLDREGGSDYNYARSQVYDLKLESGGTINLSRPEKYSNFYQISDFQNVRVWNSLSGNEGRMIFDLDLANEGVGKVYTDQLQVDGEVSGNHIVGINFIGDGPSIGNKATDYSINWLISQNAGSMTLTNERGNNLYIGSGMLNYWALVFVPDGGFDSLSEEAYRAGLTNVGNGKGCWHLIKTNSIPLTPLLPPEVTENINMGTSSGQALAYLADLEDLRKRLGEVRYGAQDGGWVKVFTKKDSVNTSGAAGFQQETHGFNIGVDRLVKADETQAWLLGGAFRYSKSDQDGIGIKSSTGKLYEYSLKSYATWMSDNGSYADLVAQIGRYEQKLDGLNNTGTGSSHASYNTVGYGLSAELGHMFSFGDSVDDRRWYNHFFVEPQIQLSYFHVKGQDYTTSTGLSVSQGNANFLTGRAGLVLGQKFNYGTVDDLDRRYFQVGLLGGVKHEFLGGDQTISYTGVDGGKASVRAGDIAGTRFYYGVNFDWQITENFRLYAQANREEGDHYTKDYDVSLGGKLLF